jgi:hypothetical protein
MHLFHRLRRLCSKLLYPVRLSMAREVLREIRNLASRIRTIQCRRLDRQGIEIPLLLECSEPDLRERALKQCIQDMQSLCASLPATSLIDAELVSQAWNRGAMWMQEAIQQVDSSFACDPLPVPPPHLAESAGKSSTSLTCEAAAAVEALSVVLSKEWQDRVVAAAAAEMRRRRARQASYCNKDADANENLFWAPDRVRRISSSQLLPGEVAVILQGSEPPSPTVSTSGDADTLQGVNNSEKASSTEQSMDDPLANVFGPEVADWLRSRFPGLR